MGWTFLLSTEQMGAGCWGEDEREAQGLGGGGRDGSGGGRGLGQKGPCCSVIGFSHWAPSAPGSSRVVPSALAGLLGQKVGWAQLRPQNFRISLS